jgi:hypothetical protein
MQPVMPQPREPRRRLRFGIRAAPLARPRRPLQIVFRARGVEQLQNRFPIRAVVRRVVYQPRHLQRRAKVKRALPLLHPHRRARHRFPRGVHHRHREVAFPDLLDPRQRRRPPRRACLASDIRGPRPRQRAHRDALPVVNKIKPADLHRLPFETKSKRHLRRVRRIVRSKRERHKKLLPFTQQRVRAFAALVPLRRRFLHHESRIRRARLVTRRHRPRHKPQQPHVALRHRAVHRRLELDRPRRRRIRARLDAPRPRKPRARHIDLGRESVAARDPPHPEPRADQRLPRRITRLRCRRRQRAQPHDQHRPNSPKAAEFHVDHKTHRARTHKPHASS